MSFFYANDERKIDNSKNINVPAFKEHLSLTLFSKLYSLNMKILNRLLIDSRSYEIIKENYFCVRHKKRR